MSTLEIKQELHRFIDTEHDKAIKKFYKMAKAYMEQLKSDHMTKPVSTSFGCSIPGKTQRRIDN